MFDIQQEKPLKDKAKDIRELVNTLNEKLKDMEGRGCTVKVHCNDPFNKIDFITIEQVIKL